VLAGLVFGVSAKAETRRVPKLPGRGRTCDGHGDAYVVDSGM